jgi:enoyl-CoA hydratase/carnithine racemase
MTYRNIRLEVDGRVATLFLDRPPGNLLGIDMMDEVNQALLEMRAREAVDVLVLRGASRLFSEGLDLSEHRQERLQRLLAVYSRIFETIRMIDMVTIAAVEGKAWGSGFELALGCNLIVPRVVPRRRAMEWILTGNEIPARELAHVGLLNRLFPPDGFDAGLEAFIGELAGKSGPVLQLAKRAQYEAYYSTYEEALYRVQNLYLRELMDLEDPAEGITAHLEGRAPAWKNR